MEDYKKVLFDRFNKFINEQEYDGFEVCIFIKSLLTEHGHGYYPTGCFDEEYILKDNDGNWYLTKPKYSRKRFEIELIGILHDALLKHYDIGIDTTIKVADELCNKLFYKV